MTVLLDQTDPLTGLLNRDGAFEHLAQHLTGDEPTVAVLLCAIDGVRDINLMQGTDAGDNVLRSTAAQLRALTAPGETLTRVSGSEFLIIVPAGTIESAWSRATALLAAFDAYSLGEASVPGVELSIGIAATDSADSPASLMRDAAAALKLARPSQDGSSDGRSSDVQHRMLATGLRTAIRKHHLDLAYQPVLDVRSGKITGSEALVRWNHPTLGAITPDVFVPLAERLDLISDLGDTVLLLALRQQAAWMHLLGAAAPRFVAVNVSAHQVVRHDFARTVASALRSTGVPASALTLEITETALVGDLDAAVATMTALKDLGVTLDIDDFGTGYSSLAYLTRLPAHAVKIDKSFIESLGADARMTATVSAVIGLAKELGLHIVAEGVEAASHLAWLRERNCDMVQGYYVSPPLAANDFTALVVSDLRW